MARRANAHASATHEETTGALPSVPRLIVVVSFVAAVGSMVHGLWGPRLSGGGVAAISPSTVPVVAMIASAQPSAAPEVAPVASPEPSVEPTPAGPEPRIGIVAGHWEHDTGAVCPDGLQEVDINVDIAKRVAFALESLGYETDLFLEFDPRLEGYWALALLSIHADSCDYFPNANPPATGFKVARVEDSLVPEEEDQLVACLSQCYAARTGMYYHANSVTHDMTRYHTFYEVHGHTPAAIIETGFMQSDRQILTEQADLVAQGIVDGLVCFLEGDELP